MGSLHTSCTATLQKGKAAEAPAEAVPAAAPAPHRFQHPSAGQPATPEQLPPAHQDAAPDADFVATPADAVVAGVSDGEALADGTDPAAVGGDAAESSPLGPSACPPTPDVGSPVTPAPTAESGEEAAPADSSCGSCDVPAAGYAASERSAGSCALPAGRPALGRASPSGSLCSEQSSVAMSRIGRPPAGAGGGAGGGAGQQLSARRQIRAEMGEEAEGGLNQGTACGVCWACRTGVWTDDGVGWAGGSKRVCVAPVLRKCSPYPAPAARWRRPPAAHAPTPCQACNALPRLPHPACTRLTGRIAPASCPTCVCVCTRAPCPTCVYA